MSNSGAGLNINLNAEATGLLGVMRITCTFWLPIRITWEVIRTKDACASAQNYWAPLSLNMSPVILMHNEA